MTGYVRVDTSNNIADGNVISAADLDNEFDGVQAAFNASTGHNHDGTTGEGAPILVMGPTQDVVVSSSTVTPKTTNTVDIGSSSLKFKDLFLAGNASIAGTLAVTGVATFTAKPILSSLTASQAVFTDASKGLVSNAITGTGNVVMSTSPTLVTPALGTPSSATLTNATGLPISTGVSGLGANVAAFLATPSSANLAAAVTDETGTGALVFATSPTLVTPALGTPSSATLTNATGLPISTGVSGLGTGVATALAVNVGTAGAPVVNGGVLGTPSSGTLTNATGLPISTGVSGLGTGVATFLATPTSANLAAAVTNETGSGALVFATSPTLVTPALGTPSSATLTNATGLPISTGVSGLGTGVATALAVNVGTAGSPVVNGGALGTPSSGTLTNATGLPIATGVSGLGTGVATFLATPSSANLRTAVTDETGTGALVFATSPTLVTPALGTPSSGVVTNLTGTASININGTVGATTPSTGNFTVLTENASPAVVQTDIGTAPNEIPLNQYLGELAYMNAEAVVIQPQASVTPNGIGDMVFQLTSDTSLEIKVKGSDGTVRSVTLTLA